MQIWTLAPPAAACEAETVSTSSGSLQMTSADANAGVKHTGMPASTSHSVQQTDARPPCVDWRYSLSWQAPMHARHTCAVRRLAWRTVVSGHWQLASCSDDHAIRTYDIRTCKVG